MKHMVVLGVAVWALLGSEAMAGGRNLSRDALDQRWEAHMLAGTSEGGLRPLPPNEAAKGSWAYAIDKPRAIELSGHPGLLGSLLGGRGWSMSGGMIDRARDEGGQVELYTKWVQPFYGLTQGAPPEEESWEFFLLYRPDGATRAQILGKWVFSAAEARWYVPEDERLMHDKTYIKLNTRADVRGYLAYDAITRQATVRVTGLKAPFEAHVDVGASLAE